MSRYFNYTDDDYVAHFGIKGMKWGVRRYQNNDGSLTPSGKSRYNKKSDRQLKLEAKYQQKGKSKAEAEAAAKKRIKIEKTIAISAGIALGTAATVALIKKYKGHSNNIIAEVKDKPYDYMDDHDNVDKFFMDNWVKIADAATDKFQQKVKPDRKGSTTYSSATGANWTDLLREAENKNPGLINDIENILEWD